MVAAYKGNTDIVIALRRRKVQLSAFTQGIRSSSGSSSRCSAECRNASASPASEDDSKEIALTAEIKLPIGYLGRSFLRHGCSPMSYITNVPCEECSFQNDDFARNQNEAQGVFEAKDSDAVELKAASTSGGDSHGTMVPPPRLQPDLQPRPQQSLIPHTSAPPPLPPRLQPPLQQHTQSPTTTQPPTITTTTFEDVTPGHPTQNTERTALTLHGEGGHLMMYRCPTCGEEAQWIGNIRRHIRKCTPADKVKKSAMELRIPGRKRPPRRTSRGEKTATKTKGRRGRRGRQGQRLLEWRETTETLEQKKARQRKGRDDKFAYWVRSEREMPEWCVRRLDKAGTTRTLAELRDEYTCAHPVWKRRNTPRGQRRLERRTRTRSVPLASMVPHAVAPPVARAEAPPVPPHTQPRPPLPQTPIPGVSVSDEAKIRCIDLLDRLYAENSKHFPSPAATPNEEAEQRGEVEGRRRGPSPVMATDRPPPEPPPPPDIFAQFARARQAAGYMAEANHEILERVMRESWSYLPAQAPGPRQGISRSRRRWQNRDKLQRKRASAKRRRRRRGDARPTTTRQDTVWLTGKLGEPRLSLQYRVKPDGLHQHVTIGATVAFVNVRTLRQSRKVGYSGSLTKKDKKTANNWKIPMLVQLMREKGIYLLALQETRRTSGVKQVGDGYLLVTSQNEKYSWLGGTGFLLSPSAAEAFRATNCKTWTPPSGDPASGRYLEIGLASGVKKEGIITFASVYAPTAQTSLEVRQSFWTMMEGCMNPTARQGSADARRGMRDPYFVMGDWNARIGKRRRGHVDAYGDIVGPHNFSNRNANGVMMLESLAKCRMKVANTFFEHDRRHTATWTHSATGTKRVIDHVVTHAWYMRHIIDVQSRPTWNVDSDHEICTVRLRGNPRGDHARYMRWSEKGLNQKKSKLDVESMIDQQFSTDTEKFPDNNTVKIAEAMEARLGEITDMTDFDRILREVAEAVLKKQSHKQTWEELNRDVIEEALRQRRIAMTRASEDPTDENKEALKQASKSLRKITRSAMTKHMKSMCIDMQALAEQGKGLPRHFFKELEQVKRFLGCYERPKHELLNDIKRRINKMDNFFKKRFCAERPLVDEEEILSVPPIEGIDVDAIFSQPDKEEIMRAVKALKNGKAADITGCQAEVLKAAMTSTLVSDKFAELILAIWTGGGMPPAWLQSLGCTIWKGKHPKSDLTNWRLVNLIAITSKVVTKLVHWRLQRLASCVWDQSQCGFRPGAWTMDAVFVVTRLMEDFRDMKNVEGEGPEELYRNTLYLMFEDYSTAFDGVPRELLWKILKKIFKIPTHIVDLLKKLHDGFRTYSVVNNMYGAGFATTSGVRQGCINGPDLWNFHMQAVMWAVASRMVQKCKKHGVQVEYYLDGRIRPFWKKSALEGQTGTVKDSTFADDSAVPADGLSNVGVFEEFHDASQAGGSVMSLDNPATGAKGKTKAMKVNATPGEWEPTQAEKDAVTAGGIRIPFVDKFIYLGSVRTPERDLGIAADIERRIQKGTSVMAVLIGLWRSKEISRKVKGQLMVTYAVPTALYGCSCWALTKKNIRRLGHWWFKMLKWAYGVHTPDFQSTGLTKKSMLKALGVQPIMVYVKRAVIVQIGHIARKPVENPGKQLLLGRVANREPRRGEDRTGKQVPRTLQQYYETMLREIPDPRFDMRIWSLQAQDRDLWREMSRSVKASTHGGGGGRQSMANRAQRYHAEMRESRGETRATPAPTDLRPSRVKYTNVCPLKCGWKGDNVQAHILKAHPLHPVHYKCTECEVTSRQRSHAVIHSKSHGGAATIEVVKMEAEVYKWDHKKNFLRVMCRDTGKPKPTGWLSKTFKGAVRITGPTRVDELWRWDGKDGIEAEERKARRRAILGGREVRELSARERRMWMKTKSARDGWISKEKLPTGVKHVPRGQRRCGRRCGWSDHVKSTKFNCPIHPDYVGHLKTGGKPKNMRGNTAEAAEWRRTQMLEQARAAAADAADAGGDYVCRRQCGMSFRTKMLRLRHESRACVNNKDGTPRHVHRCSTPGCTRTHVNQAAMEEHERNCKHTFDFESPTCPSCGYQVNNKVMRDGVLVVKGEDRNATALWEKHVKRFRRTRMVRCIKCTEMHLIPGCMATPRDMGRQFQCSDNFMDVDMGSRRCRERYPRADGRPEWMDRWKEEVEALAANEVSTEEEEMAVLGSTPMGLDTDLQNGGERRINMLRGPPQPDTNLRNDGERQINMLRGPPAAGEPPTPYDAMEPDVVTAAAADMIPVGGAMRNEGRGRAGRNGRRRRRRPRRQRRPQPATAATPRPRGRWFGHGVDAYWQEYQ